MILRHFWKSFFITVRISIVLILLVSFMIRNLGHYLEVEDNRMVSDVIIVPSGGGKERIDMAIELYNQGFARKILVSGRASDENAPSNAESMYIYALRKGIPAEALIQEPNARNTWENLYFAREIMDERDTKILLVTSAYHMKRLQILAQEVFPDKSISVAPVSVPFWQPNQWWRHPKGGWLTISESMKIFLGKWGGIWYSLERNRTSDT